MILWFLVFILKGNEIKRLYDAWMISFGPGKSAKKLLRIFVRLLPESGSIRYYKCYKHADLSGLEEGVNFPVDHSCCYMLVS
jgi:hypothetical protein